MVSDGSLLALDSAIDSPPEHPDFGPQQHRRNKEPEASETASQPSGTETWTC